MHVIVTIEMCGIATVQRAETVELFGDTGSDRSDEARIEEEAMARLGSFPRRAARSTLSLAHGHRNRRAVERLGEVEVQPGGSPSSGPRPAARSEFAHVDDRRCAGHSARTEARGDPLGGIAAGTPIVRVHDQ